MASPARRALAPLDANKPSPSPIHFKSPRKNISALLPRPGVTSPVKKRTLEVEERAVKRSRVEGPSRGAAEASIARSASPDASVRGTDTQPNDTRCSSMERERESRRRTQTRKMAGDLVARLRLAKYKVRTGQAHVPFTQLEARVPRVEVRGPSPTPAASESASKTEKTPNDNASNAVADTKVANTNVTDTEATSTDADSTNKNGNTNTRRDSDRTERDIRANDIHDPEADKENDAPQRTEDIPPPPAQSDILDEDETPCSIRGGAASGLLRLSQGSP